MRSLAGGAILLSTGKFVARKDEDRETVLRKRGFSRPETEKIIVTVLEEEGRPPESIFDFVQGVTALARGKPHQEARLELSGNAAKLLPGARGPAPKSRLGGSSADPWQSGGGQLPSRWPRTLADQATHTSDTATR